MPDLEKLDRKALIGNKLIFKEYPAKFKPLPMVFKQTYIFLLNLIILKKNHVRTVRNNQREFHIRHVNPMIPSAFF